MYTVEWGFDVQDVACEVCGSAFLIPKEVEAQRCPNCRRDTLDPVTDRPYHADLNTPPEMVVPFTVTPQQAAAAIQRFTEGIPFRPKDLEEGGISQRMQRVYLPVWLVDGSVEARWKGEAGYFYEVVSHRENYVSGQWRTQEVKETRTRWEPRIGELTRNYQNIPAPALERFSELVQRVGGFDLQQAQPYSPESIQGAFIQVPNRLTDDAWPEAASQFHRAAGMEVQQAASADDFRGFKWQPSFSEHNWTRLLLPLYTTYYLDDQEQPRVLFVHGQTGKAYGARRASRKRANPRILITVAVAFVIAFFSVVIGAVLAVTLPPAALLGVFGLLLAIAIGFSAIGPIIRVSQFNKRHENERAWLTYR